MAVMAKKTSNQQDTPEEPEPDRGASGDRHKPSFMVRIPARFAEQLDRLVRLRVTDRTTEVVRALRELLEREHLWPPPEDGSDSED